MLPAKGLRGIALTVKLGPRSRYADRRFASTTAETLSKSSRLSHSLVRRPLTCLSTRQLARPPLNSATLRFASTTPQAPVVQTFSSPVDPPSGTEAVPTINDDFAGPSLDEIISEVPAVIPEQLGYLKDLGLDYGWGPTSLVEWSLEHVHVLTGTPWWGSIILTALFFRLAFFKLYIDAADTAARVATMSDVIKPLQDKMKAARESQDQTAMLECTAHLKSVYQKSGIKIWKMGFPLIQVPIGFATLRLLRGMAELPVPGTEEGGIWWIHDLTVADPYYVLPAVMALVVHATIKAGTELGTTSTLQVPGMQKFMLYGMPAMAVAFLYWQPAMIQLAFCFTSILGFVQSKLFRNPWMRARLGIHPQPTPKPNAENTASSNAITNFLAPTAPNPATEQPKGMLASIKDRWDTANAQAKVAKSNAQSKGPVRRKHGRTAREIEEAQRYEEKYQRQLSGSKKKAVK